MRERVLLIEDDPALARLVQKKLQKAGYVVDIARTGEEGLAGYAAGSYGALIVDYLLPGRDGLEVVGQLAAENGLPPTIMVTACGSEKVAVAAMKLGVGDYIVKDIGGGYLDLLAVAIERVVRQHRLARQKLQAEDDLRREKRLTEASLNALHDVFFVLDPEGNLVRYNRALNAVSGFSDEDIASMKPWDFCVPDDRTRLRKAMERAVREGEATLEVTALTKDGRRIPYEIRGTAVREREGGLLAICGVARDISERKPTEEELQWQTSCC